MLKDLQHVPQREDSQVAEHTDANFLRRYPRSSLEEDAAVAVVFILVRCWRLRARMPGFSDFSCLFVCVPWPVCCDGVGESGLDGFVPAETKSAFTSHLQTVTVQHTYSNFTPPCAQLRHAPLPAQQSRHLACLKLISTMRSSDLAVLQWI